MSIKSDYHMHSNHSSDSDEAMENMILKSIDLGLDSICFTEHHDIDYPVSDRDPEGTFILNTDSYLYDLIRLRSKYEDKIKVMFGVEIGMQKHLRRELAVYAKSYDFDFIIGSKHLLDQKDPYYRDNLKDMTDEEMYREYFKEMLEDLKVFNNFDVLGHLDYVIRYGYEKDKDYSYDKYKDVIDPVLAKLIDMEKGLEVNTGGLKYGLRETNPGKDILKRYRELGGEIVTIGSDAHSVEYISYEFEKARDLLLDCGFSYYSTFEKRVAEYHRL
ncbi:MAG: histidinol-phosphatase HisJ family protein [Lachnospiraceae bacterium]|nr:histidinol-phosphatase HisJ family protein [Lachnospiraceae bacterium]